MIARNVADIREKIAIAARKSGREPDEIKLVGVTKTIDAGRIKELLAVGVTDIGENRVQEFLPKYEHFQGESLKPKSWHFIGHLQRNKVKFIIDKVDLIHSVDSLSLAEEINKQAKKIGRVINILVEINIAGETSKFGIRPDEAKSFAESLKIMENIQFSGLMCVPPFVENSEENRRMFEKMRDLSVDISNHSSYDRGHLELSCGMTGDFSEAIESGATIVRIGTALFGNR